MDKKQKGFILFAILLAMVNLLTSDVYVSAFPEIQAFFSTSEMMVGWSLSIFFIGSIITTPIYGPLSDKIGRKPTLLIGLVIFFIGSLGCYFSSSIEMFLISRFIQATGVCATYVLWQPMVVDIYPPEEVQKVFATVMPFLGISPALGPLFGGLLTDQFGWQSIFTFLIIFNIILVLWTCFFFKESLTKPEEHIEATLISSYKELATNKAFWVMGSLLYCV